MPRKKTTQPAPLEVIQTDDGITIEIRDESTREIGRGKDKSFQAKELEVLMLSHILDVLFKCGLSEAKTLLNLIEGKRTISQLAIKLQLLGCEQGERDLWDRAQGVRREWRVLNNALAAASNPETLPLKNRLEEIRRY